MNGLNSVYKEVPSEVPSYGWFSDIFNPGKKSRNLKNSARAADYMGKGQTYYDSLYNDFDSSTLDYGTPYDYIRDADHAFDEYTRRDPSLMHVALYGYDPDGTAAEWATQALEGDSANRASNIGRIHYGKFGQGEGRQLLMPGYYDQNGNMVRPHESSALQEILNTGPVEPEYQEYEPGLNHLTQNQLQDAGVNFTDTMKRDMSLRPDKYERKAAPQTRVNDYIEFMKNPTNKDVLDAFQVSMNLTPELVGTDDTDTLKGLFELYSANAHAQGLTNQDTEMPTIGLEQQFQYSPDRDPTQQIANLKRLYSQTPKPEEAPMQTIEDRLSTRENYVAPERQALDLGLSNRAIYGK